MKSNSSPKKTKQRKTLTTSLASDASDDVIAVIGDASLPEAHEIDWANALAICDALALRNAPREYESKSIYEQIVVLANNFSPTDIRPVYMLTAAKSGYDTQLLKMKMLKSMKMLAPELAKISISLINANTDIDIEDDLPTNITVK